MLKRLTKKIGILTFIAFFSLQSACTNKEEKDSLTVYAASSLTDVLTEIGHIYEEREGTKIYFNFAGSGTLAQQILASTQADAFISANEEWMDTIAINGKIVPQSRRSLLQNQLVIIAHKSSNVSIESPTDLLDKRIDLFAMADPSGVPAGKYTREWLRSIEIPSKTDLWSYVSTRRSYSPHVRAALNQVAAQTGIVGFVYKTDYASQKQKLKLLYEVPLEETAPINYPVALLKKSQYKEEAHKFIKFLEDPSSSAIFQKHGFITLATAH